MTESIVVGVDGSECANRALDWAVAEAVRRNRPLHIVHAVDSRPYRAPLFTPPETVERMTRLSRRVLEDARERVRQRRPDLETATTLAAESTPKALMAESENAYELVLGNRGHGGFASMLLGSTSLRMAARTTVPLVVVRGDTDDRGEVVVGLDLTKDEETTLRYAFDVAALRGARLRVVHAWLMYPTYVEAGYAPEDEKVDAELRKEIASVIAPWRAKYPQVDVVEEVLIEHPVVALTNASRNACLVVTGAHARSWSAPRLGSISHGAVHHAQCPVAVVPRRTGAPDRERLTQGGRDER
ncbi:universal stress protein [Actinomadura nitritigenes]|uniref:Universal stress protein n=1 Tax=Actinomadura nitritigenes TaxID=134602 RepID=A0ABS3RC85_9ACTN|nr:universal stress protein [Actinomadura nitritigenes]MBO2443467.1 universal stress protein [Actinomadura nitritigenes]